MGLLIVDLNTTLIHFSFLNTFPKRPVHFCPSWTYTLMLMSSLNALEVVLFKVNLVAQTKLAQSFLYFTANQPQFHVLFTS